MIAEHDGKSYVLATLQDPAAVVVYDITDPTNPTWDSGAIAQFTDYSQETVNQRESQKD